jgi:hypothetical protein
MRERQHDSATQATLSPDAQGLDRCFALNIPVRAVANETRADESLVRVVLAQ